MKHTSVFKHWLSVVALLTVIGLFDSGHSIQALRLQPLACSASLFLQESTHKRNFCKAFFPPDDDIKPLLLDLVTSEDQKIDLATFRFTDSDFAQALIQAHQRGVRVRIVADIGCLGHRSSKLRLLKEAGIVVFGYPAVGAQKTYTLMHNKFIIFGEKYLWTGSLNFTMAAMKNNQENVVLMRNADLIKDYKTQFERLIERSTLF